MTRAASALLSADEPIIVESTIRSKDITAARPVVTGKFRETVIPIIFGFPGSAYQIYPAKATDGWSYVIKNPQPTADQPFRIKMLGFTEAISGFTRGMTLNNLLHHLKDCWTLEHEAICYFIHCLLRMVKGNMRNFTVFKSLIGRIFPGVPPMAAVLQLQMTSYRYRRVHRIDQNYPFNDASILNAIAPDWLEMERNESGSKEPLLKFNVKKRFLSDALLELSKYFDFFLPYNAYEFTTVIGQFASFYEENDLFSVDRDRLPLESASQARHLEAFTAFGTLMMIAFICSRGIPFIVSRVVIRHAFDGDLLEDDFEDWPVGRPRSIDTIRSQLDAIRIGAMKLPAVKHRELMRLPYFPRVFQMLPFCDFQDIIHANPHSGHYIVFRGVCEMLTVMRTDKVRVKLDLARLKDRSGSTTGRDRSKRKRGCRLRTVEPPH
jgi:hypothetical protein